MSSRLLAVLLSGAALVGTSIPASAIEAEAVGQALVAALSTSGKNKVSYDAARQDGANVVLDGFKLDSGDGDVVRFAQAVVESPAEGGQGVFDSPRITFNEGAITGESTGAIGNASITNATIFDPKAVPANSPTGAVLFANLEANDLRFTAKDQPGEMTVARISVETGNVVENVPQDNKGTVEDLTIPPEFFATSQVKPSTLGYDTLVFDVTWDGSRDPAANTVSVRDATISMQDGGTFSLTGKVGNLPEPREMNDADATAKATEMEVHTLTLRYDDQSLAGRVLDLMAQQQGVDRAQYVQQISGALPFLLAALNNPEFQNQVAGALGAFLQDPKSLSITIAPQEPISAAEIIGIASTAPQSLPERLKASVTANAAQ
jgi:hypothetical protein